MNKKHEIIDLTYEIYEEMLTFNAPWHTRVSIKEMGDIDTVGRETREIVLGTHTGTHIDAPLHFISNGKSIEHINIQTLFGKVNIIDFSFLKDNEYVTIDLLNKCSIVHPRVVCIFGWGKHWGTKKFYSGYPYFSKDAALYLIDKGIEFIAMDTPSPDDSRIAFGTPEDSKIHKLFLSKGVILAEYLANTDKIPDYEGWSVCAMPLKLQGADGSPARIFIFR